MNNGGGIFLWFILILIIKVFTATHGSHEYELGGSCRTLEHTEGLLPDSGFK